MIVLVIGFCSTACFFQLSPQSCHQDMLKKTMAGKLDCSVLVSLLLQHGYLRNF